MTIELISFLRDPDCNHSDSTKAPDDKKEQNLDTRLKIYKNKDGTETVWKDNVSPKAMGITCIGLTLLFGAGIAIWLIYRYECKKANDKLVDEFCDALDNYLLDTDSSSNTEESMINQEKIKKLTKAANDASAKHSMSKNIRNALKKEGRKHFYPRKFTPQLFRDLLNKHDDPSNKEGEAQTFYDAVAAKYGLKNTIEGNTEKQPTKIKQ
jgi:hypothetical protein